MSDIDLRSYMLRFPGSFVGFLDSVANILKGLGNDWLEAEEKHYADVFHKCAESISEVSSMLNKVSEDYAKKQVEPMTNSSILDEYKNKVLKLVK